MLEKNVKYWQIPLLQKVTHKSLCNLISDGILLHLDRLVHQLDKQVDPGPFAENVFIFGSHLLIHARFLMLFILHRGICLLIELLNNKVMHIVLDHQSDDFVEVYCVLHLEQEVFDVLHLYSPLVF